MPLQNVPPLALSPTIWLRLFMPDATGHRAPGYTRRL